MTIQLLWPGGLRWNFDEFVFSHLRFDSKIQQSVQVSSCWQSLIGASLWFRLWISFNSWNHNYCGEMFCISFLHHGLLKSTDTSFRSCTSLVDFSIHWSKFDFYPSKYSFPSKISTAYSKEIGRRRGNMGELSCLQLLALQKKQGKYM